MSLALNDRWVRFAAVAAQTDFDTDFEVFAVADVAVWRERGGVGAQLVADVDYTISTAGVAPFARVSLTAGATAGDFIVLLGDRTATRTTDFVSGDLRSADLNDEFDRLTALVQELQRASDRSVALVQSEPPTPLLLPSLTQRANKIAAFDGAGAMIAMAMPQLAGPQPRGVWALATIYILNDLVASGGSVYRCTSGHTSAALTQPGVGANWATVWSIYQNPSLLPRGAWTTATVYQAGDVVTQGAAAYLAFASHTSAALTQPGIGANWATVWQQFGSSAPVASVFGRTGAVAAAANDYAVAQITNSVDTGVLGSTLDLAVAYLNQHRLYPGWIVFSATENIFSLTLECDGSAVSRTTYARLFAAIGTRYGAGDGVTTFNLPDYRGEILRGWDHGRGADPDRLTRTNRGDGTTGDVVGSKQSTANLSHAHSSAAGSFWVTTGGTSNIATAAGSNRGSSASTATNGGSESRPRNVYVLPLIVY
jgi:microcystin-dependent protein